MTEMKLSILMSKKCIFLLVEPSPFLLGKIYHSVGTTQAVFVSFRSPFCTSTLSEKLSFLLVEKFKFIL